ncbi:MAG: hypothetical protein Q9191_007159 [Dirinaria sp. TL-2023a]
MGLTVACALTIDRVISGNTDNDDWLAYFGGSDGGLVTRVYSAISHYKLTDPTNFDILCDPTSSTTQCGNNAAASTNTQGRPLITLCEPFFDAPAAQGCTDPATQGDSFDARFQDAILLHEFTHLNTVNGKQITDNPTGQGPNCYDVACTKDFVATAEHGGSAYAVSAKTEGLAAAYVFFAWGNWAKSPQCVASD